MQSLNVPKIQGVLSEEFSCDFKWQWNIPHASHQNGVVETLIKSVRQSLNATCKNQPLRKNNGEHFYQRQPTSSTDDLCIQVLTTSGKVHPSHRTISLLVNIFRHLNRTRRKDQPQGSSEKYTRSSQRILEMLDEILRAKFITKKQVVPNQRKCSSR